MKAMKLVKLITGAAIGALMAGTLSITAFAVTEGTNQTISGYAAQGNSVAGMYYSQDANDPNYISNEWTRYAGNGGYYYVKTSDEAAVANTISGQQQANNQNQADYNKVSGQLSNMPVIEPDIKGAVDATQGFQGAIKLILGVLVVVLSMGATLFTAFDIAYIVFPVFRGKMEAAKSGGGGGMMSRAATKTDKNGDVQLRLVSNEAQKAVADAETGEGSALGKYFMARLFALIVLSIMIFILLTGNLTILTDKALQLVSGILRLLK